MKKAMELIFLTIMLLGLPLAGVLSASHHAADYLGFPPRTQTCEHAAFSWPVFIVLAIAVLATVLPFIIRVLKFRNAYPKKPVFCPLPWWGRAGLFFGATAWLLAWTRFEWFAPFQRHTFTPLWLAYIIVANALAYRRTGHCLLTHQTKYFLGLFPLSAGFWWFFEYLNRFVQNWHYTACGSLSGGQYFVMASLSFATVLPAVLSTEEWLSSIPQSTAGLEDFLPVRFKQPRRIAAAALLVSAAGLFFIGWFPGFLFPLLWMAPLLLLTSFQCLKNGAPFFPNIGNGDWRHIFRLCLASLICGFFWEMWNLHSQSKWIYTVPYVNRFHLFEMPVLGYSGYLPFGLECAVVAKFFLRRKACFNEKI